MTVEHVITTLRGVYAVTHRTLELSFLACIWNREYRLLLHKYLCCIPVKDRLPGGVTRCHGFLTLRHFDIQRNLLSDLTLVPILHFGGIFHLSRGIWWNIPLIILLGQGILAWWHGVWAMYNNKATAALKYDIRTVQSTFYSSQRYGLHNYKGRWHHRPSPSTVEVSRPDADDVSKDWR